MRERANQQFTVRDALCAVGLFCIVLPLPFAWQESSRPIFVYAAFSLPLFLAGAYLLGSDKGAVRGATLGGLAATVAVGVLAWLRGFTAFDLLVRGTKVGFAGPLQDFVMTLLGFSLTAAGFVAYCAICVGSIRALLTGRRFVGAVVILVICYWTYAWFEMVDVLR